MVSMETAKKENKRPKNARDMNENGLYPLVMYLCIC